MKLNGKVVVVTGGGDGMGRELVMQLLARGARVAAVDIRESALRETAQMAAAGSRLSLHTLDITDRAAVADLPALVEQAHGSVDALINNAGIIQPFVPVAELDYDHITRVMDVNFYGTLNMVKAFLPGLLQRPQAHIANVSSMGGFFPFPGQSVYGASKAAVKLLTEGLFAELQGTSVGVSVIMPGAVKTGITQNSGVTGMTDPGDASRLPMTSAQRAARIMLDGIEGNKLYIFVGKDARLMNVAIRIAPRAAILAIQKQMKGMISSATTETV